MPTPRKPPPNAVAIATRAADLVGGDRDRQHGSKAANHQNIADLWNAYLGPQLQAPLTSGQIALLMALFKIARTKSGAHNLDDYIDGAGYMACAGEIIGLEQTNPK